MKASGASLAGRICYVELQPLDILETARYCSAEQLHIHGGYPRVVLNNDPVFRQDWLEQYIRTYIERYLPLMGLNVSPVIIRRLWEMLAWQNGNLLNASELGRSLGLSSPTVSKYIDVLENAYLVRQLQPWFLNIGKRVSKSPKVYIRDSSILHRLLGIGDMKTLLGHPSLGNSREGFIISQISSRLPDNLKLYFYRTLSGNEMDLVISKGTKPVASIEMNSAQNRQ